MFHLIQAMASTRALQGTANDGLSSALLIIYLDCANNLPVSQKSFLIELIQQKFCLCADALFHFKEKVFYHLVTFCSRYSPRGNGIFIDVVENWISFCMLALRGPLFSL